MIGRYPSTNNAGKKFNVQFAHTYTFIDRKISKFRQHRMRQPYKTPQDR
ncbi:MAG: hypothetical protein QXW91_01900 [Candidatus Nitrosotenuis sp.]